MRWGVVVACVVLAGCTDPAPQGPEVATPQEGSIDGVVVDAAIRPIEGANITLEPGGLVTTTDATGAFQVAPLPPGSYLMTATAAGFLATQTTVTVMAGESAPVRLSLVAEQRNDPFALTTDFEGFVQASAGLLTPVLDVVAGGLGLTACRCTFLVHPDPGLSRMVLEATWVDSVRDPTGATEYVWQVTPTAVNATAQGQGPAPLRRVLGTLDFGAEDYEFSSSPSYQVRIYPDASWPAVSQQYDAFLSMWYRGPPPDDWAIIT